MFFLSVILYKNDVDIFTPLALYSGDDFKIYQIISHMFLHSSVSHIFFNMLFLFLFGSIVEKSLGYFQFIILYLTSGIGAAILQLMIFNETGDNCSMVGASGAIFGVVAYSAFIKPSPKILSIFSLRFFVLFLILSEFHSIIFEPSEDIAHWAHIGGAITAIFFHGLVKSISSDL